ncbi:MAG: PaaI family thioesterase [Rhodoferax sp.]
MWSAEVGFGVPIPFIEMMGFVLTRFENGRSEIRYTPRPEHLNSHAIVHGGALMTLLDVAMATAARSAQPDLGMVTVEMKTSFMRPALGDLRAEGRLLHRSTALAFLEATIYDHAGRAVAHALGTFKYVKRKTRSARSVGSAADAPVSGTR